MDLEKESALSSLALLVSACSLAYQFLFVRLLSFSVQNEVLVQSVSLGVFLLFVGVGMQLAPRWLNNRNPKQFFFFLEFSLSLFGASVPLFVYAVDIFCILFVDSFSFLAGDAKLLVFLWIPAALGFFTGFELPTLFQLQKKKNFLHLLSFSYFGAIAGALGFSLFLFPRANLGWIGVFLGFLNLCLAVVVAWPFHKQRIALASIIGALCLYLQLFLYPGIQSAFVKTYVMQFRWTQNTTFKQWWKSLSGLREVERISSPFQMIDLVPDGFLLANPLGRDFSLFINGQLQFTRDSVLGYHESMVFGAFNLAKKVPTRVLVLGGGDGLLAKQLLRAGVEFIRMVEIDPKMIELARKHPSFVDLNGGVLQDSRVEVVEEDAFVHLISSEEKWDAIFLDLPFPTNYDLLKLYSVEFYERVRNRLSDSGFLAFDAPVWAERSELKSSERPFPQDTIFQTLKEAGFSAPFIFGPKEPFFFARKDGASVRFSPEQLPKDLSGKTYYNLVLLEDIVFDLDGIKPNRILKPQRIKW